MRPEEGAVGRDLAALHRLHAASWREMSDGSFANPLARGRGPEGWACVVSPGARPTDYESGPGMVVDPRKRGKEPLTLANALRSTPGCTRRGCPRRRRPSKPATGTRDSRGVCTAIARAASRRGLLRCRSLRFRTCVSRGSTLSVRGDNGGTSDLFVCFPRRAAEDDVAPDLHRYLVGAAGLEPATPAL